VSQLSDVDRVTSKPPEASNASSSRLAFAEVQLE
jgi:hypothetical protein